MCFNQFGLSVVFRYNRSNSRHGVMSSNFLAPIRDDSTGLHIIYRMGTLSGLDTNLTFNGDPSTHRRLSFLFTFFPMIPHSARRFFLD